MDIKFSIIVPVFNGADTIGRLLGSCIIQKQYIGEVLIINDNSTDKTSDIVLNFKDLIPIKVFNTPENSKHGASNARQIGLENAQYDWVVFADADDIISFSAFQFFEKMIKEKPNAVYVGGAFSEINDDFQELYYHIDSRSWLFGKCFKKSFLDQYGIRFPKDARTNSDTYFMTMFDALTRMTGQQCVQGECHCYYWIMRNNSVTHNESLSDALFIDSRESTATVLEKIQTDFSLSSTRMKELYFDFAEGLLFDTYYKLQGMYFHNGYEKTHEKHWEYVCNLYARMKKVFGFSIDEILSVINQSPEYILSCRSDAARIMNPFVERESIIDFFNKMELENER